MFRKLMGQRIADLRRARGLTQEDLAEAAGWSRPLISQVELGNTSVAADRLLALCEALGPGVNPGDLLPTIAAVDAAEGDPSVLAPPVDRRVRPKRST